MSDQSALEPQHHHSLLEAYFAKSYNNHDKLEQ
jgi:hypothetical protein